VELNLPCGGNFMWVITIHSKNGIKMFEFSTEKEARDRFEVMEGCKILSEIIYFNDKQLIES
jgi:hypothetical protein